MRNPIPEKLKAKLASSPFYSKCCLEDNSCDGHIQWHHHFSYGGKNLAVEFSILPLCVRHHAREKEPDIQDKLDWVMICRMTDADFETYNKINWTQKMLYLSAKFVTGTFKIE